MVALLSSVQNPRACIIGAGPYGISIAAHLRLVGVEARVFGTPMRRWISQMPKRNYLKSEGCASSLSDPTGHHTLTRYCRDARVAYSDFGTPVSRETFMNYALWFQRELAPDVEEVAVDRLDRSGSVYELHLSSGEYVRVENVVVATGLDYMAFIPEKLASLPDGMRTHSANHSDFSGFKGMDVAVIGGGQSALETAAELHEAGAAVHLLVRGRSIEWTPHPVIARRSSYERLRWPSTRLGPGLQAWVYDRVPGLFHRLPRRLRIDRVANTLGPAGAWWLRDRVVGKFPLLLGHSVQGATASGNRVTLHVAGPGGLARELNVDHVVAATGYRFNLVRIPFLSAGLKETLRHEGDLPKLDANFESSAPGLYFTGLASSHAFGPVMRFVAGTHYTARRICGHLTRQQGLEVAQPARAPACAEL